MRFRMNMESGDNPFKNHLFGRHTTLSTQNKAFQEEMVGKSYTCMLYLKVAESNLKSSKNLQIIVT